MTFEAPKSYSFFTSFADATVVLRVPMVRSSPALALVNHFMASAFLGSPNNRAMSRSWSLIRCDEMDDLDCLPRVGRFIQSLSIRDAGQ